MSFLFEIQSKKKKSELIEKKRVSMDVRAPGRPSAYPFTNTSQKISAGGSLKTGTPLQAKRFDGVKTPVSPASVHYAKRVSEIHQSFQAGRVIELPAYQSSRFENLLEIVREWGQDVSRFMPRFTPNKLVYGSIMSGVAFGMISLGLIEKTFESSATASEGVETTQKVETVNLTTENYQPEKDVFMQYFSDAADAEYQAGVRELVKGHPIEEMLPYIFEKDRITAAFLIGIAKKESNWGKRVPVLDGQDCFNYWGYRGQRRLMGTGGHTCFNSRKDAVDTVAKRLEKLINSERLDSPEKLIVWKCGMSCEGHSRESVQKWISDVDAYYSEMMALEGENGELEEPTEGS